MAQLGVFTINEGVFTVVEKSLWPGIKEKLRPLAWAFYDAHKDIVIRRILGFAITWGSFGIAAAFLTAIIGPRPVSS